MRQTGREEGKRQDHGNWWNRPKHQSHKLVMIIVVKYVTLKERRKTCQSKTDPTRTVRNMPRLRATLKRERKVAEEEGLRDFAFSDIQKIRSIPT